MGINIPIYTYRCAYKLIYMHIQWGEIDIRTYENFHFLSFKHRLNKIFRYIYCIRIYSTNMCI